MQRRTFIGGSAAILAAPLCLPDALAEQPTKLPVIGYLIPTAPLIARVATAFLQGLRDAGYVEGQNVSIEYRWADGDYDRLAALAADLVARKVDVIAAVGGIAALAAKNATSTIPIVFMGVGDPVGEGLVASLARPGGNLTGFSNLFVELHPKRLELLSELLPKARVIALLVNPNTPSAEHIIRDMQEAARAKGVQLPILKASTEGEIDAASACSANCMAAG